MGNLPPSLPSNAPLGGQRATAAGEVPLTKEQKLAAAGQLMLDLRNPDLRENAILELSKSDVLQDLPPLLWNSLGTITALLQEIASIYALISSPNLTSAQVIRVFNAIMLLQCVAFCPDSRMFFLTAHLPLYLYPFLNTTWKSKPLDRLRFASLAVIAALVEVDDSETIVFLLSTKIVPLCLQSMEMGDEFSKPVAAFIVHRILLDDVGLDYICTAADRVFVVGRVLGSVLASLVEPPPSKLLKYIIGCYLRLSDEPRACDMLRSYLPIELRDGTFNSYLLGDLTTMGWLQKLLHKVGPD